MLCLAACTGRIDVVTTLLRAGKEFLHLTTNGQRIQLSPLSMAVAGILGLLQQNRRNLCQETHIDSLVLIHSVHWPTSIVIVALH